MRFLILFLFFFPTIIQAGVHVEFDSDTYWPGQPINIKCSYSNDPKSSSSLLLLSYLADDMSLPKAERRTGRGRINISKNNELKKEKCKPAKAPLVPGEYIYQAVWHWNDGDKDALFQIPIIVTPLPKSSHKLEVLKTHSRAPNNQYYPLLADISLHLEDDRCYAGGLSHRGTRLLVVDKVSGEIFSNTHYLTLNCAVEGNCTGKGYHCLKSGHFNPTIRVPKSDDVGDWVIALAVVDTEKCTNRCQNLSDYKETNVNIITSLPYYYLPPEPKEPADFFFERITKNGTRPAFNAAVGEQIRLVLSNPSKTTERQATITIGKKEIVVELKPDGHRLVSEIFTLTQEE